MSAFWLIFVDHLGVLLVAAATAVIGKLIQATGKKGSQRSASRLKLVGIIFLLAAGTSTIVFGARVLAALNNQVVKPVPPAHQDEHAPTPLPIRLTLHMTNGGPSRVQVRMRDRAGESIGSTLQLSAGESSTAMLFVPGTKGANHIFVDVDRLDAEGTNVNVDLRLEGTGVSMPGSVHHGGSADTEAVKFTYYVAS